MQLKTASTITRKASVIIVLSFLLLEAKGSFSNSDSSQPSYYIHLYDSLLHEHVSVTQKRTTLGEKVLVFFLKQKLKRQLKHLPPDLPEAVTKANRYATWSFIFALLSFVSPLFLIAALFLKDKAGKKRKLLSAASKNRLKVVNIISIFWLVILLLAILAVLALFIYGVGLLLKFLGSSI